MIDPDELLAHARALIGQGRTEPTDADVRRGISASYYATYHALTYRIVQALIENAPADVRAVVRRSWTHTGMTKLARGVTMTGQNPRKDFGRFGPLPDVASNDHQMREALRLFTNLQGQRDRADYDHLAVFDKATLQDAVNEADEFRLALHNADVGALQAFATMVVIDQGARTRT